MAFDLRELARRQALCEAVQLETTMRGFSCLPSDLWLERGMVAVLAASSRRPQLVVVRGEQGGWWFVGVQRTRDRDERQPWTWPFLLGYASIERIEEVERMLDGVEPSGSR